MSQEETLDSIEDGTPWRISAKGWFADALNPESDHRECCASLVDATIPRPLEIEAQPEQDSLLLRLVLEGTGQACVGDGFQSYGSGSLVAVGVPRHTKLNCRFEKGRHRMVSFRYGLAYLKTLFAGDRSELRSGLGVLLPARHLSSKPPLCIREPLTLEDRAIAEATAKPPAAGAASGLWFRAKAAEILSHWCYQDGATANFSCSQQRRAVIARTDRAKADLKQPRLRPLRGRPISL